MSTKNKVLLFVFGVIFFWIINISLNYYLSNGTISLYKFVFFDIPYQNTFVMLITISFFAFFLLFLFLLFKRDSDYELNFLTKIIDQSNDAIYVINEDTGLIKYINNKVCNILIKEKNEILNKEFFSIDLISRKQLWKNFVKEVKEKGHHLYESQHLRSDGTEVPVEVNVTFVSHKKNSYLLAISHDISERKQAEKWYQTIIRATNDGFWVLDADGRFVEVNKALCYLTGYSQAELVNMTIYDVFVSPEEVSQHLMQIYITGSGGFETHIRSKEGHIILLEASVNYVAVGGGCYFAFLRDITERKEMEEALSAEKERLAVTLSSIADGVIATDTKGRIVLMNPVAENLTGWTREEALNLPVSQVFHIIDEKTGIRCENPVERVLKTGKPMFLPDHTILIAKNGTKRILADSGSPIIDQNNKIIGVVMVFQDKTVESQTEKELQKVEKLSSLSLLAGGIAHDFNNILAVILGNLTLIKHLIKDEESVLQNLAGAEKAGMRAKDLAQQLLTFARGGTPVKELYNLAIIINDSARFATVGSQVRCEINLPDNLWPAEVDPGQINQVVHNLVINSVQAMPDGGVIQIKGENITFNGETTLPLSPGRYIKISVEDDGAGIWADHLSKIFDPYFTTKQKGSGLGLATVYSIIKNHGGYITANSTIGKGTTFTFYLPALSKDFKIEQNIEQQIQNGKGKILVMDDEEMVRESVGKILRFLGYETEFAEDGAKALDMYIQAQEVEQPYDVVITDLTIPGGMGGKETMEKLLQVDPQVKAIVFSGYADDPVMSRHQEFGFKSFIKKPYTVRTVGDALYKVMNQ